MAGDGLCSREQRPVLELPCLGVKVVFLISARYLAYRWTVRLHF